MLSFVKVPWSLCFVTLLQACVCPTWQPFVRYIFEYFYHLCLPMHFRNSVPFMRTVLMLMKSNCCTLVFMLSCLRSRCSPLRHCSLCVSNCLVLLGFMFVTVTSFCMNAMCVQCHETRMSQMSLWHPMTLGTSLEEVQLDHTVALLLGVWGFSTTPQWLYWLRVSQTCIRLLRPYLLTSICYLPSDWGEMNLWIVCIAFPCHSG